MLFPGGDQTSSNSATRVPWRSRISAIAAGKEGDTPERRAWRLHLLVAARARDASRARALLEDLSAQGHTPEPREYHCAAAACALTGDVAGVLGVMQQQHARGGRALPETCVLCADPVFLTVSTKLTARWFPPGTRHSSGRRWALGTWTWQWRRTKVSTWLVEAWHQILRRSVAHPAMPCAPAASTRAGYDDHASWLVLVNCMFASGASEQAFEAVKKGEEQGHVVSSETALHMLQSTRRLGLLKQPQATRLWEQFQRQGVPLSRAHYNAFMESMFYTFGVPDTLQMEIVGSAFGELDTEGVNMALSIMAAHPSQLGDSGDAHDPSQLLRRLEGNLRARGCEPTAVTHVLALDVAVTIDQLEVAMHNFRRLAATPEAGGTSGASLLSEAQVARLLRRLATQGRGENTAEVLQALLADGLPLPAGVAGIDVNGRTLATRWLAAERGTSLDVTLVNIRMERSSRMQRVNAAAAAREERVWRGARFNMPSLSKMRITDLRTEALALGLPDEGPRKDVYDRVRAARQQIKEGTASPELMALAETVFEADTDAPAGNAARRAAPARSAGAGADDGPRPEFVPLQSSAAWRQSRLSARDALAVGTSIGRLLSRLGAQVTQADLISLAREASVAGAAQEALDLLRSAQASPQGAAAQLYVLAAEACVKAGNQEAALRCLDEADLAGYVLPDALVVRLLKGEEKASVYGGISSAADNVQLDGDIVGSFVVLQ